MLQYTKRRYKKERPVKFEMTDKITSEKSTVTQYLMRRQYRVEPNGVFHRLTGEYNQPADPIAEVLTELRLKLGFDFFEKNLLPFMEKRVDSELEVI